MIKMATLANEQMLTTNYLELFSDDIIEAILDQATNNLDKTIEELTNKIKEHGRIRYQLLRTTSTFSNYIRFQLAFEALPAIARL
jgi:Mg2+ and Co2+ transporter CorA